jgi:hypothetical protein
MTMFSLNLVQSWLWSALGWPGIVAIAAAAVLGVFLLFRSRRVITGLAVLAAGFAALTFSVKGGAKESLPVARPPAPTPVARTTKPHFPQVIAPMGKRQEAKGQNGALADRTGPKRPTFPPMTGFISPLMGGPGPEVPALPISAPLLPKIPAPTVAGGAAVHPGPKPAGGGVTSVVKQTAAAPGKAASPAPAVKNAPATKNTLAADRPPTAAPGPNQTKPAVTAAPAKSGGGLAGAGTNATKAAKPTKGLNSGGPQTVAGPRAGNGRTGTRPSNTQGTGGGLATAGNGKANVRKPGNGGLNSPPGGRRTASGAGRGGNSVQGGGRTPQWRGSRSQPGTGGGRMAGGFGGQGMAGGLGGRGMGGGFGGGMHAGAMHGGGGGHR